MRSLKSVLGTSLIDETTRLGRERTSFRDLIAYYLGAVKRRAEQATGRGLCDVVHGRPAHFVDGAPEALRSTRFGDALTTCEISSDRLPKLLIVGRQAQIGARNTRFFRLVESSIPRLAPLGTHSISDGIFESRDAPVGRPAEYKVTANTKRNQARQSQPT
jgi:hypothetical protein